MENIKILGAILGTVYMFDFVGFCLWVASGQVPVDGFYVGALTANAVRLFM